MIGLIFGNNDRIFQMLIAGIKQGLSHSVAIQESSVIRGRRQLASLSPRDLRLKRRLLRFIKIRLIGTVEAWFLLYSI
jgi:hypothetical protein